MRKVKVGNTVTVVYQAPNVATGATIKMEVFDETHTNAGTFTMTEIGNTGRYWATFVPDEVGTWVTAMYRLTGALKTGHAVEAYDVSDHDIDSIGTDVAAVEPHLDIIEGKVDAKPTLAEIEASTVLAKDATVAKEATLAEKASQASVNAVKAKTDNLPDDPAGQSAVEAAITAAKDELKTEIDELESPAMVG